MTIFYSKGCEKLEEGFKEEDVVGKTISMRYKSDEVHRLDDKHSIILKVVKSGVPVENQHMTYYLENNRRMDVISNVYPIFFEGDIIAAVSIFRDITQAKQLSDKVLQLQRTLYQSKRKSNGTQFCFDNIIGSSECLLETIKIAQKVANNLSPVLIQGETGTGKELFAQSIHNLSPVSNGPFVAINCAAIPDTLLESALFGTSKGAFTGAVEKAGLFEEANNGTLFLDEINSMSMQLQSKLLRVLQTKTIMRVGSSKSITVNARVLSAINMDPRDAINKNQLRNDIYYRLSAVILVIPPLRERKDCFDRLIDHFIKQNNGIMSKNVAGVTEEVMKVLKGYGWPGNIRELEHIIEHAMNLVEYNKKYLQLDDLPAYLKNKADAGIHRQEFFTVKNLKNTLLDHERDIISARLQDNEGNISKTAKELNVSRQYLQYRIKRLGIKEYL